MKKLIYIALLFIAVGGNHSCSTDPVFSGSGSQVVPPSGDEDGSGSSSDFDGTIQDYNGEMADDAAMDVIGDNNDFYWEANSFTNTVAIDFKGSEATVTTSNDNILYYTDGAYVTVDMQSNSVKNVEIVVSGKSDDGSLKIYGSQKFKLSLNGLELTSGKGPAINSQCKKRMFIHLADGTTNRLTDAATYSDDKYYLNGATADSEDRKGCFFSEGNMVYSGTGALIVKGNLKHAIVTDGYFWMRPGVTISIADAAKNGIHVKGDSDDAIGVTINGGLIHANITSAAGKCIKTDLDVNITGGKLTLNTSGNAVYDKDENDTSSAAGIKADGNVYISGGNISAISLGTGGKGINVDGAILIDGGNITVGTSGGKYVYNSALGLTSSPKGIKAEGDIIINNGDISINVVGASDGSEGLESKSAITVNGGSVYVYAYDDAINASKDITFTGGRVYCYSVSNDGIDSNGTINIKGGLVIGNGSQSPEEGIDCDKSSNFLITGGVAIGTGGASISPSTSSTQRTVIYNSISATKGVILCIRNNSGTPVLTYELPRTMNSMSLFFSSYAINAGETYTVSTAGSISGYSAVWNGWYEGGNWSGGSQVGTFTASGIVTTVGNSTGPGNGGGTGWPGRP